MHLQGRGNPRAERQGERITDGAEQVAEARHERVAGEQVGGLGVAEQLHLLVHGGMLRQPRKRKRLHVPHAADGHTARHIAVRRGTAPPGAPSKPPSARYTAPPPESASATTSIDLH